MTDADPRMKTALELFHGGRFSQRCRLCEALEDDGERNVGSDLPPCASQREPGSAARGNHQDRGWHRGHQ